MEFWTAPVEVTQLDSLSFFPSIKRDSFVSRFQLVL